MHWIGFGEKIMFIYENEFKLVIILRAFSSTIVNAINAIV